MVPPPDQDEPVICRGSDRADGRGAGRADGDALVIPTLSVVLRAELVSPSIARDRLATWLGGHGWPPAQTDDLVLAPERGGHQQHHPRLRGWYRHL